MSKIEKLVEADFSDQFKSISDEEMDKRVKVLFDTNDEDEIETFAQNLLYSFDDNEKAIVALHREWCTKSVDKMFEELVELVEESHLNEESIRIFIKKCLELQKGSSDGQSN